MSVCDNCECDYCPQCADETRGTAMTDYIRRQAAIDIAYPFDDSERNLQDALEDIPSADVVEVVRCADCKWFNPINNGDHGYCGTPFHGAEVYEDDYCSDGERRQDG